MSVTYRITVNTGTVQDAGTDANVYITLYGPTKHSGERLLDNAEDNFENGKIDLFSIETRDIGAIQRVRIRHDNSGNKPGWFLEQIRVQREDTGQEWVFSCQNWLARDMGDHLIDRVLYP